jgi:hypothetical protein
MRWEQAAQQATDAAWDAARNAAWGAVGDALAPPGYRVRRVWLWRPIARVGRFVVRLRKRVV